MTTPDMEMLTLDQLREAISGSAAAFRCRTRLQPAGGDGDKVFPPTYAGAVYAVENRRIRNGNGERETVPCVLLDSVQSQANRMEEALQDAEDAARISIPVIEVDFTQFFPGDDVDEELRLLDPIGTITSLQAPHRVADAILRDSMSDGQPFRESDAGRQIDLANVRNATSLYKISPTSLVFGMWDSTGPKGGLGAKFERAIVSEIVGIGSPYCFASQEENLPKNRGIRRDPLRIVRNALVKKTSSSSWEVVENPKEKGAIRPSEVNHSSILFESDNSGITIDYAEQTTVLSLAALRRLRFPPEGESWQASEDQQKRDIAARTVLAALALCAAELAAEAGMDLRSRCLLWPEEPRRWALLDKPGEEPKQFVLDADSGVKLLNEAVKAAQDVGVVWRTDPIRLTPSEELVKLVRKSQELAAEEATEE